MKRLNIALALTLLFASTSACAEGFSVGGSIGSVTVEVDDASVGVDFDSTDFGWKIYGKYTFNDYWSVEVGYIDFGTHDDSILGVNNEIEADGVDAFLIGSIPLSESFDLFGKAGFISWDADLMVPGAPPAGEDGSDLALGVGTEFHASDRFSILGEWEWFDISEADAVWMLSVGLEIAFN